MKPDRTENQWTRELITQAFDRLSSKVWSDYNKDINDLTDEEMIAVKSYLDEAKHPVIQALHLELKNELFA